MDKEKVKGLVAEISDNLMYVTAIGDTSFSAKRKIEKLILEVNRELSKSDWVSVKDGTPELDELVVACNENRPDNWWETFRDSQMSDEWKDENGFPIDEKVTHWKRVEKLKK